jgi:hypothetical protein
MYHTGEARNEQNILLGKPQEIKEHLETQA